MQAFSLVSKQFLCSNHGRCREVGEFASGRSRGECMILAMSPAAIVIATCLLLSIAGTPATAVDAESHGDWFTHPCPQLSQPRLGSPQFPQYRLGSFGPRERSWTADFPYRRPQQPAWLAHMRARYQKQREVRYKLPQPPYRGKPASDTIYR
jgi:hypothetical protein